MHRFTLRGAPLCCCARDGRSAFFFPSLSQHEDWLSVVLYFCLKWLAFFKRLDLKRRSRNAHGKVLMVIELQHILSLFVPKQICLRSPNFMPWLILSSYIMTVARPRDISEFLQVGNVLFRIHTSKFSGAYLRLFSSCSS
jgi:hypothetical protein